MQSRPTRENAELRADPLENTKRKNIKSCAGSNAINGFHLTRCVV